MLRVAIESLFAKTYVGLEGQDVPEFSQFSNLSVEQVRAALCDSLQAESLFYSRLVSSKEPPSSKGGDILDVWSPSPPWNSLLSVSRPLAKSLYCLALRADAARNSITIAEAVRLFLAAPISIQKDLGIAEMEQCLDNSASIATPNFLRAWLRLHGTLLLREQVDAIQQVRQLVRTANGDVSGALASSLIPGATWQYEGRKNDESFSLRLSHQPEWVRKLGSVDQWFALPLDGSRRWVPAMPERVALHPLPTSAPGTSVR